jgi:DedD protein
MPLSFPRLGRTPAAPPADPGAARGDDPEVEAARLRARRRLVGALVLLAVGLVTFPLLFETEPRPADGGPARRDSGVVTPERAVAPAPPAAAAAAEAGPATAAASAPAPEPVAAAVAEPVIAAGAAAASAPGLAGTAAAGPVPATATASAAAAAAAAMPASKAASAPAAPAPRPAPAPAPRAAPAPAAATPSRAAVAPPAASAVAAGRYVVQVGAYSNVDALRAVRQRVERLGLKTFTQVVETPAGPRTRLRVGPFEQRAQAEAAVATLRGAGLPGVLLTL